MTDLAHDAVEAAPEPRRRAGWAADNPLVRAVGRVRLPLGAKLLIGFGVVGVLLATGYVLGLVALGQSNARGQRLLDLRQRAVDLQRLHTDATLLEKDIANRNPESPHTFGSGLDQAIGILANQLCNDSGVTTFRCLPGQTIGSFRLAGADPKAYDMLGTNFPLFVRIVGNAPGAATGAATGSVESVLHRAHRFATSFENEIHAREGKTRAQANALVAADRGAYAGSRRLLLGLGVGSLALALALALLLSWSVVSPLRLTQGRLSAIAGGDFSEHVDVPNRDEIGALAADVNQMNDELRRLYSELEAASRHKSDFLATMSHELRTPLNAIIGFSEVLNEQMFGELNERQLAYVNDVLEAGRHLLSLINDVLDLAKIEAGHMDLELSEVEIPDLLRSAVSMNAERAERGGIVLALSTDPEEISITVDERRVRQVVFNLLSNAIKFTPAQGRIDITALANNGQIEIAVADTGPGIASQDLDTIFEEFEQTSEGKQAEGTGLGLPLSRKLVELHGGRLWVESEVGRGSTFRFTLPAHREAAR